jgi:thiol:disulfide interchange protein
MDKLKSSAVPILLIVVFGLAFAAGVRSLNSKGSGSDGRLNFASDTAAAFATAKKEGKAVMVKYGAEWCGPCRQMKEEAFTDGRVAEALKDVIVVDIDVDSPGADAEWLEDHNVGPIPTVQFFRTDGSMIGETVGYGGVPSFVAEVEKILAKA